MSSRTAQCSTDFTSDLRSAVSKRVSEPADDLWAMVRRSFSPRTAFARKGKPGELDLRFYSGDNP